MCSPAWKIEETDILVDYIGKYGCRVYNAIKENAHIPIKNTQPILNETKK